jgi:hypothetical protein
MDVHDSVTYDAFVRLMARPDPKDLPRRAHISRFDGDPDRRATRFPAILMSWLQRHYLEVDVEEPLASPIRALRLVGRPANPGLRVRRSTATNQVAGTVVAGRQERALTRAPRSGRWTSNS